MASLKYILIYGPAAVFLALFALIPVGDVISHSIATSGSAWQYFAESMTGQYLNAFETTFWLSFLSGFLGMAWGGIATYALLRINHSAITTGISALSSVLANFAGLALAVAFMITFGASGLVTNALLTIFHLNLQNMGFNLASFGGLLLVYAAFQTPLAMILLMPAFSSVAGELEQAAYTLGANHFGYLRRVFLPIVFPSLLGTFALLFANSFSAYVTAYALASGSINLVPIQIGFLLNGDVTLNIGLGNALAVEEIVVLGVSLWVFALTLKLQRRRGKRSKGTAANA